MSNNLGKKYFNITNRTWIVESTWSISFFSGAPIAIFCLSAVFSVQDFFFSEAAQLPFPSQGGALSLSLVFTSDASTAILISPWKRPWRRHKHKHKRKDNFFPFPCACAYAWFCAETSENEMTFRRTSSRIFFYHTWLCWANENTGSRLPRA